MITKKRQRKRCKLKSCNQLFTPVRDFESYCCREHQHQHEWDKVNDKQELQKLIDKGLKNKEKEKKAKKKKLNEKTIFREKVQDLAQRYGRLREFSRGNVFCVTCGATNCKFDGGHFLPKSTYTPIRYYTLQINPQCVKCNQYNGGMPLAYKEYMIERFGEDKVKWLESQHRGTRDYPIEYLKKYVKVMGKRIKRYELKLKEIEL